MVDRTSLWAPDGLWRPHEVDPPAADPEPCCCALSFVGSSWSMRRFKLPTTAKPIIVASVVKNHSSRKNMAALLHFAPITRGPVNCQLGRLTSSRILVKARLPFPPFAPQFAAEPPRSFSGQLGQPDAGPFRVPGQRLSLLLLRGPPVLPRWLPACPSP